MKEILSVIACVNSLGEKVPLAIVSKPANPFCIRKKPYVKNITDKKTHG